MPLKVVATPKEASYNTDDEDDTEFLSDSDSDHSTSTKDDSGINLQLNDIDPNYPDDDPPADNSSDKVPDSEETTDIDVKKALLEMKDMMKSLCDKVKTNEKSLKEIKDMYQGSDMYVPYN